MVGNIDPRIFESLRDAASDTMKKDTGADRETPGLWTILKRADSEDSLRALAVVTEFLESFGRRLKSNAFDGDTKD